MVERVKEIAEMMNGREYTQEMVGVDQNVLKELGIVIVFGASDDLMELRGAIDEEIGCYNGGKAHITKDGMPDNECGDEECPYFQRLKEKATVITAIWGKDGISWQYETEITHETFEIMEDGGVFCRGIVFSLEDVD